MDITLDHFKRGVTKDLLQGINIPAVFEIPGSKAMPPKVPKILVRDESRIHAIQPD